MTSGLQPATPEVESVPCQPIVTAALYQPFAFGWRSGVAVTYAPQQPFFYYDQQFISPLIPFSANLSTATDIPAKLKELGIGEKK